MNLYFRFFKVFLIYLLGITKRSKNPTETFVLKFSVWPNDLDFNFHMNNGRYLTIMDLGRFDLILRLGIAPKMARHLWQPLVGNAFIKFRRGLKTCERYELRTRIAAWDEKWFFIEQAFVHRGEVAAVGHIKGMIRGKNGAIPPGELMRMVGIDAVSPPVPEVFRKAEEASVACKPISA